MGFAMSVSRVLTSGSAQLQVGFKTLEAASIHLSAGLMRFLITSVWPVTSETSFLQGYKHGHQLWTSRRGSSRRSKSYQEWLTVERH